MAQSRQDANVIVIRSGVNSSQKWNMLSLSSALLHREEKVLVHFQMVQYQLLLVLSVTDVCILS